MIEIMEFVQWPHIVAGGLAGFIVGLTGVGGGALMTPILLVFFGIEPIAAVATDLWYAAITKISAVCVYNKYRQIDWSIIKKLWLGSIPAALLVIYLISNGFIQKSGDSLTQFIGALILVTAIGLLFFNWLKSKEIKIQLSDIPFLKNARKPLTIGVGITLGFLVALTSVGAGALGTVMLIYLYPYRLTPYKLISTEVAHAIPLSIVAGMGYLWVGDVDLLLLGNLLAGSIPAAFLGGISAHKFKENWLRIAIAIVLAIAGFKLLQM